MAYDFPASPTPGQTFNNYVWDGEKWKLQSPPVTGAVRYDIAQGLTSTQKAQGRANIDVARKNYIINGAMMVSQENGTTAGNINGYWPADQFVGVITATTAVVTIAQVASRTPSGSPNRIRVAVTTADAAVAAGDSVRIQHAIEGLRVADLMAGTSNAKTITIQFGVKAPAGTYCVAIWNSAVNQSYVAEYVIAAGEANTDVIKSITLTLNTTGTWATDNTPGLYVMWTLMSGTTSQMAANTWGGAQFLGTANQFNCMGTNGNVFELFDVSLTEGSVAPPFQVPDYVAELALCQRYYEQVGVGGANIIVQVPAAAVIAVPYSYKAQKRVAPTVTYTNVTSSNATGIVTSANTVEAIAFQVTASAASGYVVFGIKANARL